MMSKRTAVRVEAAEARDTAILKPTLLGLGGAIVEWYDFLLYGTAAALVFPSVFFPATLPTFIALIGSFSTFAVGFVARPVGAVLFGHIGDRRGRKTAFALSLILMGMATTLIGALPSYRAVGVIAPLALVLLRLGQGLAVGGQWGGATLFATEGAPQSKRGLYGSIAQAGVPVGGVVANLVFLMASKATSPAGFMVYGWRIPFLLSAVFVGFGLWIHVRAQETVAFRHNVLPRYRVPAVAALRRYPRSILLTAGAFAYGFLAFYILTTYVIAYGASAAGLELPRGRVLAAVLVGQIASSPALLIAGSLSDRYGRRRVFMTGVLFMSLWAFVLFPLIEMRSLLWITVAIGVGIGALCLSNGPLAAMFAEQFSTEVRYSAISVSYQISATVGGGVGPVIAAALYSRYHSNLGVSILIASACALSLLCVSRLKETSGTDLNTMGMLRCVPPVAARSGPAR